MNGHTPEPWRVVGSIYVENSGGSMVGRTIQLKGKSPQQDEEFLRRAESNAARIVACVNACAGMDDPAEEIERLRGCEDAANRLKDGCDYVRAQRDALAEALQSLIDDGMAEYASADDPVIVLQVTRDQFDAARAALASLEGKS